MLQNFIKNNPSNIENIGAGKFYMELKDTARVIAKKLLPTLESRFCG
jgi:hypothetical protein